MRFRYGIVSWTTHRSMMRIKRRPQTKFISRWHFFFISCILILAANTFLSGINLTIALLLIVAGQMLTAAIVLTGAIFRLYKKKAMHKEDSPLKGQMIRVKEGALSGNVIRIENWVDRMPGNKSWLDYDFSNKAVMMYAVRKGAAFDETDPEVDEVLYGHIQTGDGYWFGCCVHISELDLPTPIR
jgi:hypothetical protein